MNANEGRRVNSQEKEELQNILCALMGLTFFIEVGDICMNIDTIDKSLREKAAALGIPQVSDYEFLDIILDAIPTMYKLYKRGLSKGLIESTEKLGRVEGIEHE